MDVIQEELLKDTVKQAEYRLIRKKENEYRHYMWDKHASLPVEGYGILSIGYIPGCHTTSNVKKWYMKRLTERLSLRHKSIVQKLVNMIVTFLTME